MTNITQEDRDLFIEITGHGGKTGEKINAGEWFTAEVEMIARHRETAEAKERERIVAWLRDPEGLYDFWNAADCIEAGEHMEASNATGE